MGQLNKAALRALIGRYVATQQLSPLIWFIVAVICIGSVFDQVISFR